MWPISGGVYVCCESVLCFSVGQTCVVDKFSDMYDSDSFEEGYRYFVWLDNFTSNMFLADFRRCFVSQDEWRQSQISKLDL